MLKKIAIGAFSTLLCANQVNAVSVPGSVPPVQMATSSLYTDDTRGIAVPQHNQFRMQTSNELVAQAATRTDGVTYSDSQGNSVTSRTLQQESQLTDQIDRIANDPGFLSMQNPSASIIPQNMPMGQPQGFMPTMPMGQNTQNAVSYPPVQQMPAQAMQPMSNTAVLNNVNTGFRTVPTQMGSFSTGTTMADNGGVEIAVGRVQNSKVDMKNSIVKLREDRVSIRRVLRRMLDQIGGGSWNIVWSLSEENANLPDMEISIYTQQPFINVLNSLLARLQTKSGQSLRVVKYDNAQKIVITDQKGSLPKNTKSAGVGANSKVAVTEQVLNEAKVVLHYDEIPLVDALENIVNQASKGQWKLRVYAGMDQVLKPAHIEEPFNIAMERVLQLFNLKYEVFPGGKLVVITSSGSSSYTNMQQ